MLLDGLKFWQTCQAEEKVRARATREPATYGHTEGLFGPQSCFSAESHVNGLKKLELAVKQSRAGW